MRLRTMNNAPKAVVSWAKLSLGSNPEEIAKRSRTDAALVRRPGLQRNYIVPVLAKAICIWQLLEASSYALNIDEVSSMTGIAKTTVYRILRTFSAYGFLPGGSDGVYRLRANFVSAVQSEAAGNENTISSNETLV